MIKLYIIDGYMWIHRAYHASIRAGLTSPSGEPTGATHVFVSALLKFIREQEPQLLCVAMEGGGKTFRTDICPTYKANRSLPADDFTIQRKRIEEILHAMKIPILRVPGYEADDIIGTLSKQAQDEGFDVYICSKDKDMLQLVDEHISIFINKTGEYKSREKIIEEIGITPDKFIDYLALQGDSSDNVLGIPGIGGKTAAKLLKKYDSIENLLEHIDELKGKQKENLQEYKDRLPIAQKLVTIDCNVPLGELDYVNFVLDEFSYDEEELRRIFTELNFNQLLYQMEFD
jgi:DNA polymerase-1